MKGRIVKNGVVIEFEGNSSGQVAEVLSAVAEKLSHVRAPYGSKVAYKRAARATGVEKEEKAARRRTGHYNPWTPEDYVTVAKVVLDYGGREGAARAAYRKLKEVSSSNRDYRQVAGTAWALNRYLVKGDTRKEARLNNKALKALATAGIVPADSRGSSNDNASSNTTERVDEFKGYRPLKTLLNDNDRR